ncbi:Asp-tRNA(Asn)/Glu-tRNA(Gln) amidotransferase subunit GatC [Alicyclobacillus cycloheptanicus]|uniref:Aspartyl/glutamyl-tRNA(Asn/Gln) amidotransferase subunit C n=1 Tax=Alicyclobacillus cycloheptanicus TaxID=1457 RepID=A0ABT9XH40_9BACL|nr:aspartyl-tRNA(Asn)/glutamyl-tRNA(Gln) amidotransferase subunit C [Alicyclobacillus cycloheptanicus]WDL99934.1 Asp-tRNA(Asn)/Glu-tRNA(Gln) amidotransferase subunit GatC [Alicyclobacillus cycloheptanicus]
MKITEDAVRHVAALARLAVSDEEVARLSTQLTEIIGYAELLQSVDLTDVPPTSHPLALTNALREDESRPSLARDAALANAPDHDGEQVRVPAVLEG